MVITSFLSGAVQTSYPSQRLSHSPEETPLLSFKIEIIKWINSVSAPSEAAPSSAFSSSVAVFHFFLGLPFTILRQKAQRLYHWDE
jgi:hypothetical protein